MQPAIVPITTPQRVAAAVVRTPEVPSIRNRRTVPTKYGVISRRPGESKVGVWSLGARLMQTPWFDILRLRVAVRGDVVPSVNVVARIGQTRQEKIRGITGLAK